MKKIDVKILGFNNFQIMNKCFEDINCIINNIEYKISYLAFAMNISIQTEIKEIDVEKEFWQLYEYIGFVLGYYPAIDSAIIIVENDINNMHLDNIVEKYKTSSNFIVEKAQFINKIDNEVFKITYSNFKKLKENISFQISIYEVSTMRNNNYPEIRITNILQALDGLYDSLSFTESKRTIVKNIDRVQKVKEYINNIDLNNFFEKEEIDILKKCIRDSINRLELVNYDTKLRTLFNHLNNTYRLFELEKNQTDPNKNYDKFIIRCKKTRNKFSHANDTEETKNAFDGIESALYVFKIVLAFRLLVVEEIGLENNIDKEILNKYISLINKRIVEELKLEEI